MPELPRHLLATQASFARDSARQIRESKVGGSLTKDICKKKEQVLRYNLLLTSTGGVVSSFHPTSTGRHHYHLPPRHPATLTATRPSTTGRGVTLPHTSFTTQRENHHPKTLLSFLPSPFPPLILLPPQTSNSILSQRSFTIGTWAHPTRGEKRERKKCVQ